YPALSKPCDPAAIGRQSPLSGERCNCSAILFTPDSALARADIKENAHLGCRRKSPDDQPLRNESQRPHTLGTLTFRFCRTTGLTALHDGVVMGTGITSFYPRVACKTGAIARPTIGMRSTCIL